jgi:hypothetical protein
MNVKRTLTVAAASAAVAVGGVAAVGLSAAATPAHAAGTITTATLPFTKFSHMLLDPAKQLIFFSQMDPGDIVVVNYSGQTVATIPNEPNADGLTLSSDGSTVYAAIAGSQAIAAISTSTLTETARYPLGQSPSSVAYAGGKIWFGYVRASTGNGEVGSIDPTDPSALPTLNATHSPAGTWSGSPLVAASPNGELAVADQGLTAKVATYDVSSGTATALAPPTTFSSGPFGVANMQITPDGKDVLVAILGASAVLDLQVSDLSVVRQYAVNDDPRAVSITSNGTSALGSVGAPQSGTPEVALYAPGGSASLNTYSFNSLGATFLDGVAITPDGSKLFAVTALPPVTTPNGVVLSTPNLVLDIIANPAQVSSTLGVTGPATARKGHAITLAGTLGGPSPYAGGQTLHVTRTDPANPDGVALPDVTTAADGSFSITDTPPKFNGDSGTVTYQVSYAGDAYLTASTASASVTVQNNNS